MLARIHSLHERTLKSLAQRYAVALDEQNWDEAERLDKLVQSTLAQIEELEEQMYGEAE